MNNNVMDRPSRLLEEEADRLAATSLTPDMENEDAPEIGELLFDIGVALAAYLTLGLVLSLIVDALHL